MAQLMPLPLTVSCFSKIQIGFPSWYWLTWVVPDNGPLSRCVCVCVCVCGIVVQVCVDYIVKFKVNIKVNITHPTTCQMHLKQRQGWSG